MSQDPKRLVEDPAAPSALREDLANLAATSPVDYDTAAGLARLHAAINAGASATTAAGSSSIGLKLVGLALVGVIGSGAVAVVVMQREQPTRAQAPQSQPERPAPDRVAAARELEQRVPDERRPPGPPVPAAATRSNAPTRPTAGDLPDTAVRATVSAPPFVPTPSTKPPRSQPVQPPRAVSRPAAPATTVSDDDPDEWLRRETAQLADARNLLNRDPAAALTLVDAGQREFARGMFAEERAAIAIFALVQLGRKVEASQRADAFLRRYPEGAFSHRVRTLTMPEAAGP